MGILAFFMDQYVVRTTQIKELPIYLLDLQTGSIYLTTHLLAPFDSFPKNLSLSD
jgi:hypothetical protein